jgi:hypothetical protein
VASSPFLNYSAAMRVRPEEGTQVLARIKEPYFDRTYESYCSHQNTPNRPGDAEHPALFRRGNVVVLTHGLGELYYRHGARVHRDLFAYALGLVYADPAVRTKMPSAGRITFVHQPEKRRYVAHLLYAPPLQRGRCLVIEDLVPLFDVPVEVHVPEAIAQVHLVPGHEVLDVNDSGGAVKVIVPKVQCHQAVVFAY